MQRFHVNLSVENLVQSIDFYTTLFATQPTVRKDDYAKWMLEDPRVNFAITTRGSQDGIDHIGIQAETDGEFQQMRERLEAAQNPLLIQDNTSCCYAKSSKTWVHDPQGVAWETFITHGDTTDYGDSRTLEAMGLDHGDTSACCTPQVAQESKASDDAKSSCC